MNTKILESGNNGQNGSSENDRELIEFNRCLGWDGEYYDTMSKINMNIDKEETIEEEKVFFIE